MVEKISLFEEVSMNAHPAMKTYLYDGWVLRFANGYTNRANSVSPLYYSTIPVAEKIAFCEEFYTMQELPTVFKLTMASAQDLDRMLEERGYEIVTPTNLMVKCLTHHNITRTEVIISPTITKLWQDNYFRLNGITDSKKTKTAAIIQGNIQNKVFCGMITDNEKVVACGLCVVEREYAGLYDIVVDSSYRRKGYGADICLSLLNAAMNIGAKTAYLQVVVSNTAAMALYQKLGFQDSYQYWYRSKKIQA